MNKISNQAAIALLTVATLAMSTGIAVAIETPWKGSASGNTTSILDDFAGTQQNEFAGWGGGQLGNFTAEGIHSIATDLTLTGETTWVSADGQALLVSFKGQIAIFEDPDFPYHFTAEMTVHGGTGRLANATGSAVMQGAFSGSTDGKFYFDFEGSLCTHGNFHEFGIVYIESLGCGLGQISPYTMDAWNPITAINRQTGSIMPTSEPELDDSTAGMTVWTFAAQQGPNPYYDDLPLHVIYSREGLIFCTWQAQFRIEIQHDTGLLVKHCDGLFTVVGGTGQFQNAWGAWQVQYATEPTNGGDSAIAYFSMNGTLQVAPFQSHSKLNNTQKTTTQ